MARRSHDAHEQRRALPAAGRNSWPGAAGEWLNRLLASGARGAAVIASILVVLSFIGVMVINFVGQIMQGVRLDRERALMVSDIAELRRANELLRGEVDYTASDAYVERQIRDYGYAREGDVVLIAERVTPPLTVETLPNSDKPIIDEAPGAEPNWLRWWQAVFP